MADKLDSREFYELMQTYRHANRGHGSPQDTVDAFEAVKAWIRADHQAELKALAAEILPFVRLVADGETDNAPALNLISKLRLLAESSP